MQTFTLKKEKTASLPKEQGLYDYRIYHMKLTDRLLAFLIGFGAAAAAIHIFFGSVIVDAVVGVIVGIIAQPVYRNMMKNRIQKQLTLQFRDMLDALTSSVAAGKVVKESFEDAQNDMELQYGENSWIYNEVKNINVGLQYSVNIEELLLDFGERSGIPDIITFANVFAIANRRGGEIKAILGETKSILCDKIDIEQEIDVMVNSAKNELNVMMLMPLLILPMMSSFVQEGANQLVNILVKLAGIAIFVVAYLIGRKITNIKI